MNISECVTMALIIDQTFTSWCYPSGPQRLRRKFSLPHLPRQCSMFRLAGKPDSHNCYIFYLERVIQLKLSQKYVLPVRHQTTTEVFSQPLQMALGWGFYVVGQSFRKGGGQISQAAPNPVVCNRGQNKLESQLF